MQANSLLVRLDALPRTVKAAALIAVAFTVLASLVASLAFKSSRTSLFVSPLHPEQLIEVEERLAQWNVAFTPVADNVVVDAARRNDLLLRLSLAGVPHAHVATTNEALANVGVLTPQAVVEAQTRSGLAGEIEIALRSLAGVDDARVIIAPAKVAEFADQHASDASASVRLQLHPGAHLSRDSIAGIRSFVAASVTALEPSRVTILDDRGVAMASDGPSGEDANELEASLQSALDQAFGPGAAIVRVRSEYTSSEREAREVRRMPLGAIARETSSESFDGQGRRYEKNDERDDRGSDTQESVTKAQPGALARTSTAVFVDAERNLSLANIRALAAATVGYESRRGDVLTVEAVDFHHPRSQPRDAWFLLYGVFAPLLPTVAIVLGLVVAARFCGAPLLDAARDAIDRLTIARRSQTVAGYSPAHVRGALVHEPPHAAAAIISALPAATAAAVLELYPEHERQAIVQRMQRAHAPIIPDAAEILGRHA